MADARTEKQKVKEITDRLEEGLKELFEGERYKSYLNTMSKFHNYSANNIQLIEMQCPGATYVAGYKACDGYHAECGRSLAEPYGKDNACKLRVYRYAQSGFY